MNVQSIDINALQLDPAHPRRHSRRNLAAIRASLARFGQQRPIVVGPEPEHLVLAGNATLKAARMLGWRQVAIVRSDLTGHGAAAYALADNRCADLATWDPPQLAQTLARLQNHEALDHLVIGFSAAEIEQRIDAGVGLPAPRRAKRGPMIQDTYQVLVSCTDETEQREVFERLHRDGHECRVLTL